MNTFEITSNIPIYIACPVSEPLILAAQDLVRDIWVSTGRTAKVCLGEMPPPRGTIIVRIAPEVFPEDALENYRLHSEANNQLCIDGSDMRGAIYGIYAFSSKWLRIDPAYLWTQLPPRRLSTPRWHDIQFASGNPAIRYRGVFINDEDLLTGWEIGGPRHTTYKYYHTVISRNTAKRVAETLIRMGYNLAIPASFVDIRNPEEEMLLEEFSRRGLILTMHHVEPLGVSAFGFDNYWEARGEERSFSYFADPDALREVWRDSIRRWSKYPEVIWQLGLRGRGDRPFWEAGLAPESDEERAAVISRAISEQQEMVREMTGNPDALFSTTLWGEGSVFNSLGLLDIPADVITVFSDNCAGWRLQDDFFHSPNNPDAAYGLYCHHAIMLGTHLSQAIGAADFHAVLTNAMATRKLCYAIFNAANIREFVYGLVATAKITAHPAEFSPAVHLRSWVENHFSAKLDDICACYKAYFAAFEKNSRGVALFNDGLLLNRSVKSLRKLLAKASPEEGKMATADMFLKSLADGYPDVGDSDELVRLLERQEQSMADVYDAAVKIQAELPQEERPFLFAQLVYPAGLNRCFCRSARHCHLALQAFWAAQPADVKHHLTDARAALKAYEALLPDYLTGEFTHWYDGNAKVDYRPVLTMMDELLNM
ncbi:MAG: glycosyl hydrolase 115 family protein [Victivallales bacterium]|nr:glycosyl hydrolase 115 family protein [Victivallales bacterium]